MANEMKIFKSEQFGAIRTMVDDQTQEVLFNGKDVAAALGYKNPTVSLNEHCKGIREFRTPSKGGPQKMKYIPEADVYRLVMRSTLPDAEKFQDWVCEVVLPQIRITGGYIPFEPEEDDMTTLCKAFRILQNTIALKDNQLETQRPQVEFANALAGTQSSIQLSEMAKLITENGHEIGRTRLYAYLRKHNYIFQNSTEPRQEWVSNGIFEVKATIITTPHGNLRETIVPLVTVKGQEYFLNLFKHVA